jgi:hypothetical protein
VDAQSADELAGRLPTKVVVRLPDEHHLPAARFYIGGHGVLASVRLEAGGVPRSI